MTARAGTELSYRHDAAFYASDQDFLGVVGPFLQEGVAAGEPTLAALSTEHVALVRSALPAVTGITFLPGGLHYDRPASTIRAYQELFAGHVAAGADAVGEVPHPGVGASWEGWARYEAAIDRAYSEFPLWGLCPYDRRTTPPEVVDEVERTHRHLLTSDGRHLESERYENAASFLAGRPRASPEALEREAPALVLVQPRPAAARRAVGELSPESGMGAGEVDDLIIAVSEVVTNAIVHGRPPTTLRAWTAPGQMVVTVHDSGPGPSDPFVGLMPSAKEGQEGGFGLWIAHQLCRRVTLDAGAGGFTVRLVAGSSSP